MLMGTALAFVCPAADAVAQSQPDGAAPEAGRVVLDDIVVTARRRDERLQDVPDSVTAFSQKDIANAGIRNFRDIADLTPNLSQLDSYRPGQAQFQVRGLITPQVGDPPLVFVFDGVTSPDIEFVNQDLFDIERVEVLRGAQGALYGRGAIGGAVNIVTRQPTNRLEGNIQASYANGETWRVSSLLSGPIAKDKVYFRVGGYYTDSNGLIPNVYLNTGADYNRDCSIFGMLKFELGPDTTFDLRGRYGKSRSGAGYYQSVTAATIEDFSIPTSQNVLGVDNRRIYEISAKLEHRFDFATLVAVAGYSNSHDDTFSDGDYVALPGNGIDFFPAAEQNFLDIKAFTFESRLTSVGKAPFSWALGVFYQDKKRNSVFNFFDDPSGTLPIEESQVDPASLNYAILDQGRSKAWALSAQAGYKVTDRLELTVAGRYDSDSRRSLDERDVPTTFARNKFTQFQPKASLSYKLSSDFLVYGGYSKGFRSGGFNEYSAFTARTFDKETSDSYELGFKSSWLNRALTLNGALFLIDQRNAQYTQFNPLSFTLENISIDRVRSQGAELEIALQAARGLSFRLNAGYTDSKIRAYAADPTIVGTSMPYVSKYNGSLSADYDRPVRDGIDFILHADYQLRGPRSFSLDLPDVRSSPHSFVDLRSGIRTKRWEIVGFAKNLFNERQAEDIFVLANGAVDLARQPNRPRSYGVEARFNF